MSPSVPPSQPPLWTPSPSRIKQTLLARFMADLGKQQGQDFRTYDDLWQWSVDNPGPFWQAIWDWCGVVGDRGSAPVVDDPTLMPGAKWFADSRLNYAENLLHQKRVDDDDEVIVFWAENRIKTRYTYAMLYDQVSRIAQALHDLGVRKGDRVAGYMPNMPETVIAMLATTSLGAIWSSASPDFGVQGVLDRFGQIEPKVLFAADGYYYNGKAHDSLSKIAEIADKMPSVQKVILTCFTRADPPLAGMHKTEIWRAVIAPYQSRKIPFERVPFDHPLYIMFSSGTTGVPKCIVHGTGGTLLQHLKEHKLHCDIHPTENVFYFTTCGWMMWNWLVSALASEATLLLYDGSPFYPSGNVLWDYAEAEECHFLGTSAKWIDACAKADLNPKKTHKLKRLKTIASTGSPLAPESFEWVYGHVKEDLQLASISGGTDIVSCFMLGSPISPVYRGEIQKRGLGLKVQVYNDDGQPVVGEKGELVCTQAFPCMPIHFWNDPDGTKYRAAYFERFPGVWTHGDYVELTDHGGIIVYGRSDATLNPGGVRIGTAEIYRQVETIHEVVEAIVVGQDWSNDVRVVLFVRLREGFTLTDDLIKTIRTRIRENCTPRHVPAKIVAVDDIPRTKSGKIVELAVRDVVHGRPVKNQEALANPGALEQFRDRPELQGD